MDAEAVYNILDLLERVERLEKVEKSYSNIGARVYNNADLTIPDGALTALTFNTERYDTDNIHDAGNPSRLTCTKAGKQLIIGNASWEIVAGGRRGIFIRLNGITIIAATEIGAVADAVSFPQQNVATIYDLAVGDYVELVVFQSSGGNLDITFAGNYTPEFMMHRLA